MKALKRSLVVAIAAAVLAGCGLGSDGTASSSDAQKSVNASGTLSGSISFQTWSLKNDKFTSYFTKLISSFEQAHPGTHVNWVDQPANNYADKVSSQVQGGNLPDVVNLPPDIAYQVAKVGAVLNLDKSDPTLHSTYVESALKTYAYSDLTGTFGFPWYLGTDVDYWNKDMLTKAGVDVGHLPTDLDQLFAAAKKVHDSTDGKVYLVNQIPRFNDFVSAGIPLTNSSQTKFVFNTPAAAKIVDEYTAAYQAGYIPDDALYGTYQGTVSPFIKGEVAYTTGTGYYIKALRTDAPTLAPKVIPSRAMGTPPLYVQGLSVSAKSKNPALALAFAEYATDNANQTAFVGIAQGFLPGTSAAQSDPNFVHSDGTPQGDAQVLAATSVPKAENMTPPRWTQAMQTYFNQQVAQALTGKISAKQALDNAVAKADQLLGS